MKNFLTAVFLAAFGLVFISCTAPQIPQMEDASCTASRETVRSFYAQHFISEDKMGFTRANVQGKQIFFTPEFYKLIEHEFDRQDEFAKANPDMVPYIDGDPFTNSQEYPSGFKVGECQVTDIDSLTHVVRLFWKIDEKASNKEMRVKIEKRGDVWQISDIIDHQGESLAQMFSREKYSN